MERVTLRARTALATAVATVAAVIAGTALAPGTASASSGTARVTISATPKRIRTGGKVTIGGAVTEAGAPVPGTSLTVDLNDAIKGYASKQVTTNAAGHWSVRVKVRGDMTATANANGIPSNQPSTKVTAVATATLKLARQVSRPWLLDHAKVTVAPAAWILNDMLQVRRAGSRAWRDAPDTSGVWGTRAGTLYVRAVASGVRGVIAQGTSPVVKVTVGNGKVPHWLRELNAYRKLNNASPVAENATFTHGDWLHVRYMANTWNFSHSENPKSKWYTKLGAEAGESSDLSFGSFGDPNPVAGWAAAPYHALSELSKYNTLAGYSTDGTYAALWTLGSSTSRLNPRQPDFQFPANGKTTSLLTYTGGESPNPMSRCPKAWRNRDNNWAFVGLPIIFGNQRTVARPSAALTSGGKSLRVCVVNAGIYGNAVFVIPLLPLKAHHAYTVAVRYKGKLQSRWRFRTS